MKVPASSPVEGDTVGSVKSRCTLKLKCSLPFTFIQMSLEQFLENDTWRIAAAYELTKWSILKAEILDYKEKEKEYTEFLEQLAVLVEKYKVSDADLFDAQVSLDADELEDEEMLERADKLIAKDESWM